MTRALPFRSPQGVQPERSLGIAFALLVNAVFFMVLIRQPELSTAPIVVEPVTPPPQWKIVKHDIKPDPVPVQRPRQDVHIQPNVLPRTDSQPVVSPQPTPVSIPSDPIVPTVNIDKSLTVNPPPAEASLDPIVAPAPAYPREALYEGIGGTVELELLVGADGRVLDARVVRSSGNRLLDNAARDTVLRQWRFQPATRNGEPVQALGRLPVVFSPTDR